MDTEPGTVRQEAETKRTAIKTDLPSEGFEWFVFDLRQGGHYSNGVRDGVAEWPLFVPQ